MHGRRASRRKSAGRVGAVGESPSPGRAVGTASPCLCLFFFLSFRLSFCLFFCLFTCLPACLPLYVAAAPFRARGTPRLQKVSLPLSLSRSLARSLALSLALSLFSLFFFLSLSKPPPHSSPISPYPSLRLPPPNTQPPPPLPLPRTEDTDAMACPHLFTAPRRPRRDGPAIQAIQVLSGVKCRFGCAVPRRPRRDAPAIRAASPRPAPSGRKTAPRRAPAPAARSGGPAARGAGGYSPSPPGGAPSPLRLASTVDVWARDAAEVPAACLCHAHTKHENPSSRI